MQTFVVLFHYRLPNHLWKQSSYPVYFQLCYQLYTLRWSFCWISSLLSKDLMIILPVRISKLKPSCLQSSDISLPFLFKTTLVWVSLIVFTWRRQLYLYFWCIWGKTFIIISVWFYYLVFILLYNTGSSLKPGSYLKFSVWFSEPYNMVGTAMTYKTSFGSHIFSCKLFHMQQQVNSLQYNYLYHCYRCRYIIYWKWDTCSIVVSFIVIFDDRILSCKSLHAVFRCRCNKGVNEMLGDNLHGNNKEVVNCTLCFVLVHN